MEIKFGPAVPRIKINGDYMAKILKNNEKNMAINNILPFYDLYTCSRLFGKEVVISLSKKLGGVTYSDLRYTTFDKKDFKLYFKKEKLLIGVVLKLLQGFHGIYVFDYGDKWIKNKRISPQLNQLLNRNKVSDDNIVLELTDEQEIVAFVKSIFRYNTFASFFVPSKRMVLTPTDHLDIFISSKDDFTKEVENIIKDENKSKILRLTKKEY